METQTSNLYASLLVQYFCSLTRLLFPSHSTNHPKAPTETSPASRGRPMLDPSQGKFVWSASSFALSLSLLYPLLTIIVLQAAPRDQQSPAAS